MKRHGDHRWLLNVARHAGHVHDPAQIAPLLATLSQSPLRAAWQLVAHAANLDPVDLARLVAAHYGLTVAPHALLETPDATVEDSIPAGVLKGLALLVLERTPTRVLIATADPTDIEIQRLVQFAAPVAVRWCVAPPDALPQPAETSDEADAEDDDSIGGLIDADAQSTSDSAIVKLCNQLFHDAATRNASDVHIQPLRDGGVVRMRIDGVLHSVAALPRSVMLRVIARIKLLADMDPTNQMQPQDGRLRLRAAGRTYDMRVSSVPANNAEKLVVRMLGNIAIRSLRDVGLVQPELDQLGALLSRRIGMILITGPTGSGKTTTLFSALAECNDAAINIATVEDPVEIRLPGATQIEVNAKAGLTFASALRTVLRQDPDIVLIGEIRDRETAEIAVQAALTGHLVLASLHANDALAALPRLLDLGISPMLLSQSLAGTCAQRLVRRLCEDCAESVAIDGTDAGAAWLKQHGGLLALRQPRGCPRCNNTGYRGRVPLMQVLSFSASLAALVQTGASFQELGRAAHASGMRLLAQSAFDRLAAGDTSLDEVLRELGGDFWTEMGLALGAAPHSMTSPRQQPQALDETGTAPILVIARDARVRAQARTVIESSGRRALDVPDALQGKLALQKVGAIEAMLIDFTRLSPSNVEALMTVRETLGAAAIPILGLTPHDDSMAAFEAALTGRAEIYLRPKPSNSERLGQLLERAIAVLN